MKLTREKKGEKTEEGCTTATELGQGQGAHRQSVHNNGTLDPLLGRLEKLPQSRARAWLALILVAKLKNEFILHPHCKSVVLNSNPAF